MGYFRTGHRVKGHWQQRPSYRTVETALPPTPVVSWVMRSLVLSQHPGTDVSPYDTIPRLETATDGFSTVTLHSDDKYEDSERRNLFILLNLISSCHVTVQSQKPSVATPFFPLFSVCMRDAHEQRGGQSLKPHSERMRHSQGPHPPRALSRKGLALLHYKVVNVLVFPPYIF